MPMEGSDNDGSLDPSALLATVHGSLPVDIELGRPILVLADVLDGPLEPVGEFLAGFSPPAHRLNNVLLEEVEPDLEILRANLHVELCCLEPQPAFVLVRQDGIAHLLELRCHG